MSQGIETKAYFDQNSISDLNARSTAPKWLTVQFLEKHLQHFYDDKLIRILSFKAISGTGKRENFCSSLFRVHVTFTNDPESSVQVKLLTRIHAFDNNN